MHCFFYTQTSNKMQFIDLFRLFVDLVVMGFVGGFCPTRKHIHIRRRRSF